jgi:hypothetical protein
LIPNLEIGEKGRLLSTACLRFQVLRTPAELVQVREVWLSLQTHPEADLDFFLTLIRTCRETVEPFVLAVYQGVRCVCLVAGRIQETLFQASSGGRVFWQIPVRRLAVFYDAFMGGPDKATTGLVIERLLEMLRTERIDLIVWDGVHWTSTLRELLHTKPALWCRDWLARPKTHWRIRLLGSLEEIFQTRLNKKRRYWARRTIRLIEEAFPDRVRYVSFTSPTDLEKLFHDAALIARQTQQWQQRVGFCDTNEQRDRLTLWAQKGALRALILYVEQRPISFWICTQYDGGLYLDFTGFAPSFRRYEPGTLALFRIIDQACKDGLTFIDMGTGEYEYMRKYANVKFQQCNLLVFTASFRGVFLNALRLLTLGPIELIRHMAQSCGVEGRIKQLWSRAPRSAHQPRTLADTLKPGSPPVSKGPAPVPGAGRVRMLWRLAFFTLLATVVYLSWKPSPSITHVGWIPRPVGVWFDDNDAWKNIIGFGLLGLTMLLGWRHTAQTPPGSRYSPNRTVELKLLLGFCCFVVLLELGQLVLPLRVCDWRDVLAGWSGGFLAWASLYVPRGLRALFAPTTSISRNAP